MQIIPPFSEKMTVSLGRLRRGYVRGAQVVSRSEGVRLQRVEGNIDRLRL